MIFDKNKDEKHKSIIPDREIFKIKLYFFFITGEQSEPKD